MRTAIRWLARLALTGALLGSCSELAYAGRTPALTPVEIARHDSQATALIDGALARGREILADTAADMSRATYVKYLNQREP